jgi:hypothetical protein
MYSYKNYTTAGEDLVNLLNDSVVDYASNIYLGAPSYKIANVNGDQTTYTPASLNSSGILDVLYDTDGETVKSYDLFYDGATSRGNVDIAQVVSGKILVAQREVTVLPIADQYKNYTQIDPKQVKYNITSGTFVNQDILKEFIYIDYSKEGLVNSSNNKYDYDVEKNNIGNDDFDENNPTKKSGNINIIIIVTIEIVNPTIQVILKNSFTRSYFLAP